MCTRILPKEVFESYLDKKLSPDEEYGLFTTASAVQLKEFFKYQKLSSVYEEHLSQLFEESAQGIEAVCVYFDNYELEARALMNLMRTRNAAMIRYYITRHPLTKEALDYLKTGAIPEYTELLEAYHERKKQTLSGLTYDEFADYISKNVLSAAQIKSLIDENNLAFLRCYLEDPYNDKHEHDRDYPLFSEELQLYLLLNGSDNAIGLYVQFAYFDDAAEKKLIDSGNKFLILLYIRKYILSEANEEALVALNDLSLIAVYDEENNFHSYEALKKVQDLVDKGLL